MMKSPDGPGGKTLYRRVVEDITTRVQGGTLHPGDKLPSERALCEQYRVSQITVRRALQELAHSGLVYSQHGLGWFINTAEPEQQPGREIALILPVLDWLTTPLVHSLKCVAGLDTLALSLAITGGDAQVEAQALQAAKARGVSAVICVVAGPERQLLHHYARLLAGSEVPVLLLLHEVNGLDAPVAILDEKRCVEQVTMHLLNLGHQRIAYAGDDPALVEGQRRYGGFAATLWEHGLELPLDWVFVGPLSAEPTATRFRRAFQASERPTALVCASDMQAAEALTLLHQVRLRCPEDVALVGLGDREFAPFLATPLTTFHFDLEALGQAAATMLLGMLAGRAVENVRLTGHLVPRHSCGSTLARAL
jgi:GntR family transcriptional regulator, arabinose operon transcriptional repressor